MKKLLIIDGNNVMFRAFYATYGMGGNVMRNSKGVPTNMIYGFVNIYTKVIKDGYTHVAVAFDAGKKTRRHQLYKDYKGGRPKTPDELFEQIPFIHHYLEAMNVHYYLDDNYEADDIVGSIANKFYNEFDEIDVLSNDNDLFQLIKDRECQLYQKNKEQIKYTKEVLFKEKGITPEQIPDYKGIIGDKSDNLQGVDGIGPVGAAKLLQQYGTLDEIYNHIDEITGKNKEKLEASKEQAMFTKMMATLDTSYEFKETIDDFEIKNPDYSKLVELFSTLEFSSFLKKLPKNEIKTEFKYEIKEDPFTIGSLIKVDEINYLTLELLKENYHNSPRIGFGLSNSNGSFFIPYEVALSSFDFTLFLGDSYIKKGVYDFKKMYVALLKDGIILDGVVYDLLLASYLINTDLTKDDISIIASHFGYNSLESLEQIYGKKGKEILPFIEIYSEHIAKEAFVLRETYETVMNDIKDNGQEWLLLNVEIPLSKTLGKMEFNGINVDQNSLDNYEKELLNEMKEAELKVYEYAGHEFNILSPKQLGVVLFDELKLDSAKKTKTGYSTDSSVLESIDHPIAQAVLRYRMLSKLENTYVIGIRNALQESNDNHIHTIYKQALTDTGRLSSIEPNLQNLPIRNKEARELRKIFVPENNSYLMSTDYSQIELRVLAHMANEESLVKAFNNKEDIHEATAKAVLNKTEVTKEERSSAKAINFGIIYGISAWGLSKDIGITPAEASNFIKKYHETFPGILPFTDSLIKMAETSGYVETMFKRRRYIRDILSGNYNIREFSKRTAMNAPIQGTAADIIKLAMVRLDDAITEAHLHAKMILTIHDEVVLSVPKDEIEETIKVTEETMKHVVTLRVPLEVGTSYGDNLYEAK